MRRNLAPALLLAPTAAVFLLLFVFPLVRLLSTSLTEPHWTVAHYARFLGDSYYLMVLGRSLFLGAAVTSVTLVLGLPLAYWLARLDSRIAPLLILLSTFPLWVSAVVRSFGWVVLLVRNGTVSVALQAIGLTDHPIQLLYTLTGVVIALAQVLLPFMVLTLYGVIKTVDPDIERAAQNLGARPLAAICLTTLPLARNGILAGALLVFALSISAFATPSLVGGARAQLMSTTIYEQTTELLDWPFASAISVVLLVVVLTLSFLYARLGGAPKGALTR